MFSTPGVNFHGDAQYAVEDNIFFQTHFAGDVIFDLNPIILSTGTDAGNTPTTTLRAGLVMAKDSNGKYVPYDADGSNGVGSNQAVAVLAYDVDLMDYSTGVVADKYFGAVVTKAKVDSSALKNLDQQARNQLMACGFTFSDQNVQQAPGFGFGIKQVSKTGNYTVTAADNGTTFDTTGAAGAVIFTLPAIAAGLTYWFLNTVDQNMTVASAEGDNIIALNDMAADSVAFSTASGKIGGTLQVSAIYFGAVLKWQVTNLSPGGNTITVAT